MNDARRQASDLQAADLAHKTKIYTYDESRWLRHSRKPPLRCHRRRTVDACRARRAWRSDDGRRCDGCRRRDARAQRQRAPREEKMRSIAATRPLSCLQIRRCGRLRAKKTRLVSLAFGSTASVRIGQTRARFCFRRAARSDLISWRASARAASRRSLTRSKRLPPPSTSSPPFAAPRNGPRSARSRLFLSVFAKRWRYSRAQSDENKRFFDRTPKISFANANAACPAFTRSARWPSNKRAQQPIFFAAIFGAQLVFCLTVAVVRCNARLTYRRKGNLRDVARNLRLQTFDGKNTQNTVCSS